jgi:bifunctional non-homologous end joining protein LigD
VIDDGFEGLRAGRLAEPEKALVVAHYQRAAPLLAADFPHVPLVSSYHPDGLGKPPVFKETWKPETVPHTMMPVDVLTTRGEHHTYIGLTENAVLWLAYRGAVGMLSWTPSRRDPGCVGYARILLRRSNAATEEALKSALRALRAMLRELGLESIPVLDGHDGAALFLPFGDIPLYDAVREWLHAFCKRAVERHGELLTEAADVEERGNRVHLAVKSNAVGHFSSLPYSLVGDPKLGLVTPVDWDELARIDNGTFNAQNSAERLRRDVFAEMTTAIGLQRFSAVT